MKNVIGVFNPFGLIQKAGRKKTHKLLSRKAGRRTHRYKKSANKTKRSFFRKK